MAMSRTLEWSPDWLYVRIALDERIENLERELATIPPARGMLRQSFERAIAENKRVRDELNLLG